ncbi:MAG: aminotransferase class I/II-fold pyridoxal phosphate-dependent enzyme [Bacteroidales bacterium]|nr:aminotransferase class I/II-fold pyridoxal phosphate-dependent enzyme [Bacteroidales bacterium]
MKLNFECDYNNGTHPLILQKLVQTNNEQSLTYGYDRWSLCAKEKIKAVCGCKDAEVFFLCAGTQTNSVIIDSLLRPTQGVISTCQSHINVHEAGAIESCGHKVIVLNNCEEKINAEALDKFMQDFHADESKEHMVQPALVYITQPTELGSLYSKLEIEQIYNVCRKHSLQLFIDGARLGYGLASPKCDTDITHISKNCDVFYIGGTKNGALCGEAAVFTHGNMPADFFTLAKRHGAVMSKSRLIGIQFDVLFSDNLYFKTARQGIETAMQIKNIFTQKGFQFFTDSPTNQQFIILDNKTMQQLAEKVIFTRWMPYDSSHTVCRFVTSWATTQQDVNKLKEIIFSL